MVYRLYNLNPPTGPTDKSLRVAEGIFNAALICIPIWLLILWFLEKLL